MNIIVAVPVDESIAAFIGKKGSADSIAFFNRKSGSEVITALFPNQEEEKIYALAESLLVASQIVISTAHIDRKFGEAVVAASLLDRKILVTNDNDVTQILGGAGLSGFKIVSREELLGSILENAKGTKSEESVRIDIDKAFPVKGVGTVVLGVVTRGVLRQHDKLVHTSGKEVVVRSIQSQDEDVQTAEKGTRVGISLKDISDEEIEKGDLLAQRHIPRCSKARISFKPSKAAREEMLVDKIYGIAINFSYSECVVKGIAPASLDIELKAPFPMERGDELLLMRKDIPRIFASGRVEEPKA